MDRTEIHRLRLPRLVSAVVERCRETESVATWDPVPVVLRAASASEAPVALRALPGSSNPDGIHGDVRVLDGHPYVRLSDPGLGPEAAWDRTISLSRGYIEAGLGLGGYLPPEPSPHQLAFGWHESLADLSRRRGLGLDATHRFRTVRDEGTAARDAAAARLAGRLAVIGGEAWIRASLPRLRANCTLGSVYRLASAPMLRWTEDGPWGRPWDVASFRLDRPEDLEAYAAEVLKEFSLSGFVQDGGSGGLGIVDPEVLAACYDAVAPEDGLALAASSRSIVQALRPHLGDLPDDEIARFLELRAIAARGDAAAFDAWMDGIDGTTAALAAAPTQPRYDPAGLGVSAEGVLALARIRHEVVDRRRMRMASGDAAALSML